MLYILLPWKNVEKGVKNYAKDFCSPDIKG